MTESFLKMKKPLKLTWSKASDKKVGKLFAILKRMGSVVVAYSGGVDSSFLAAAAHHVLGSRALAVTALSPTFPTRDRRDASRQARQHGWAHRVIATEELKDEKFAVNPPDRCYHCKSELFGKLWRLANAGGYRWVIDGSNLDDLQDYRPGARAKAEWKVRSPLQEAEFCKTDIRTAARQAGLDAAERPASACLASRFPHGTRITKAGLGAIERAETMLSELGFTQVRVRVHGELARIEIYSSELDRAIANTQRHAITEGLKKCGFRYVTLDLEGYRMGSMNPTPETKYSKRLLKKNSETK